MLNSAGLEGSNEVKRMTPPPVPKDCVRSISRGTSLKVPTFEFNVSHSFSSSNEFVFTLHYSTFKENGIARAEVVIIPEGTHLSTVRV